MRHSWCLGLALLLGTGALTPEEEGQCGWSWGNLGCAPRDGAFILSRNYLCELSAQGCISKPGNPHKVVEEKAETTEAAAAAPQAAVKVVLALDWTPNTNHAGFFLAQAEGLYREAGIDVELRSPDDVAATGGLTPARQVAAGTATLGVAPSESAISFATSNPDKPRLLAVAAVLQGSTSAVCALADSGIERPRDLAGRRYASYDGRFEDAIVRAMVRHDGGDGDAVDCHPLPMHGYADAATVASGSAVVSQLQVQKGGEPEGRRTGPCRKPDIPPTSLCPKGGVAVLFYPGRSVRGQFSDSTWIFTAKLPTPSSPSPPFLQANLSDSTWIFTHWEGVLASRAEQALRCFRLEDHGVPYGYSPVLLAHPDAVADSQTAATLRRFLQASAHGFQRAAADPAAAAAAIMASGHPSVADEEFVTAAAEATAGLYLRPDGRWGGMDRGRWAGFVRFLAGDGILTARDGARVAEESVDVDSLFTEALLP